ncbi:MAG: hypothetical protein NTW75_04125 [Planctomycetales bacterium]|nr:hypothetical protein [Planctomycetales bacterium]
MRYAIGDIGKIPPDVFTVSVKEDISTRGLAAISILLGGCCWFFKPRDAPTNGTAGGERHCLTFRRIFHSGATDAFQI